VQLSHGVIFYTYNSLSVDLYLRLHV